MAQRQGQDSMQELEDGSVMNDVAAAEEDYEQPAQVLCQGPLIPPLLC